MSSTRLASAGIGMSPWMFPVVALARRRATLPIRFDL
jgi:hypothetical protein